MLPISTPLARARLWATWGGMLVLALGLLLICAHRYTHLQYTSDGYRYFRVLQNTLQGQFMWEGPYWGHMLAFHQFLLLPLYLPLVWLIPHPFVLAVGTILCLLAGAWQVRATVLARGGQYAAANMWGLYYVALPTVLSSALGYEFFLFQNEAFLLFLVPWAFRLWSIQSPWLGVAVLLTGLVKEEAYLWLLLCAGMVWLLRPQEMVVRRRVLLAAALGFTLALTLTLGVRGYYATLLADTIYRFSPELPHLNAHRLLAATYKLGVQMLIPLLPILIWLGYRRALSLRRWGLLGGLVGLLLLVRAALSILVFGVDWEMVYTHAYWGNTQVATMLFGILLLLHRPVTLPPRWVQVLAVAWPLACYIAFNPARFFPESMVHVHAHTQPDAAILEAIAARLPAQVDGTETLVLSDFSQNAFVVQRNFILAQSLANVPPDVQAQWMRHVQGVVVLYTDDTPALAAIYTTHGMCRKLRKGHYSVYWRCGVAF